VVFTQKDVAEKRGIAKRQTRRSANTNIMIMIRSRAKTKKVKVVKENSPFQARQIVVVSSHATTPRSLKIYSGKGGRGRDKWTSEGGRGGLLECAVGWTNSLGDERGITGLLVV
jgi:hypothetical protein